MTVVRLSISLNTLVVVMFIALKTTVVKLQPLNTELLDFSNASGIIMFSIAQLSKELEPRTDRFTGRALYSPS